MNATLPSPRRIGAMVLRHLYVLRGSWPRVVELAYWPTMQMIVWGFMKASFLLSADPRAGDLELGSKMRATRRGPSLGRPCAGLARSV